MEKSKIAIESHVIFNRIRPSRFFSLWPVLGALLLPGGVFAVTLGEVTAATAVSGALQSTAQTNPQGAVQKAKQAVERYESAQQQRLGDNRGSAEGAMPAGANPATPAEGAVPAGTNPASPVESAVPAGANPATPAESAVPAGTNPASPAESAVSAGANPASSAGAPVDSAPLAEGSEPIESSLKPSEDRSPSMHGTLFSQDHLKKPSESNNQGIKTTAEALNLRDMTSEELSEELEDQEIEDEIDLVDYKRSVQVFYKNKCPRRAKNCVRGAVFTNIKSVIFDYARSRAGFAKK